MGPMKSRKKILWYVLLVTKEWLEIDFQNLEK